MTEPSQPASSQPGAAPQAPPSQIIARLRARPRVDGRYEDGREIARGGMGAILRVFDSDLRRQLAMKVMLDEPGAPDASQSSRSATLWRHARFLEEAQITGQLDHPGIVPVHELGLDAQGRLYFTMKLVKGRDLREVFEAQRQGADGWNLTRALGVLLRVCEAMAFAHEKGVIHRDLKPANVMVGRFGEVYVMDWGLAKVLGQPDTHDVRIAEPDASQSLVRTERKELARVSDSPLATMDGDIVGTPCYMAPEQARGRLEDIGPHSDVYSLGSMLYELLSGQMPYVGPGEKPSPSAVLGLLIQGPPRELSKLAKGVPEELIAICEKAMARDVRQRYPSMLGVADDLRAFLEGRVVKAHESGAVAEFKKWIARNRGFAGTVAAALGVALALSAAMVVQQVRARERLQIAKDEADEQRRLADQKRGEAEESQRRAEGAFATIVQVNELLASAKKDAEAKEELARRKSYVANIAAAGASLRFHDLDSVRARLAECPPDLRGWEWAFLDAQCEPSMALLGRLGEGEGDSARPRAKAVLQLATDPAERVLVAVTGGWAIGDNPRSVLASFDLLGGTQLGEFDTEDTLVLAIALAPDGSTLASAATDKQVRLYDIATRARSGGWSEPKGASSALAFHPDGQRLALATPARTLRLVDARSGALEREWSDPPMQVRSVSFSPDGNWLAAGTVEGEVLVLDVRSGALRRVLGERGAPLHCVAFSPDGRRLLAASGEAGLPFDVERWRNTLREWDVTSGALLGVWREHESVVSWCGYMRAGRVVASTSHDGSVRVRDTVRGEEIVLAAGRSNLTAAVPVRGGYALVTGSRDGEVRTWDAGLGESLPLLGHRMRVADLRFMNDAVRLVSRSEDGTVRVWDARTGEQQLVLARVQYSSMRRTEVSYSLAVSPVDGRVAVGSTSGRARVYDAASGALEREVALDSGELATAVGFDARAERLAVGSSAGKVTVFDLASGAPSARLRGIRGSVSALEWLDGGQRMAVGTDEGQLGVWELADGRALALHDLEQSGVEALQRSADGALWVDVGERLRRLELGNFELTAVTAPAGLRGRALWFDDDRRLVCRTAAESIGLFDARTTEALLELRAGESVTDLAFSGDGRMLAAGFASGAIRVWSSEATAARSEARRAMLRARELALPFVERLFEERGLPREEVEAALRSDETLAESVREAALRLAARTRGEPLALRNESFDTLRSPKSERADYKIALWQALTLTQLDPQDDRAKFLLGAARYRLGQIAEAAELFASAAQLRRSPSTAPELSAFAAMTLARLDRIEEAQAEFDKLRAALLKPAERAKPSNIELRDEAAAWLESAAGR